MGINRRENLTLLVLYEYSYDKTLVRGTLTSAVIGFSLLAILLCGAGVYRINIKSESDQLWVPQDTEVMKNRQRVADTWGAPPSWWGGGGGEG